MGVNIQACPQCLNDDVFAIIRCDSCTRRVCPHLYVKGRACEDCCEKEYMVKEKSKCIECNKEISVKVFRCNDCQEKHRATENALYVRPDPE
jgi:hypothetical protein